MGSEMCIRDRSQGFESKQILRQRRIPPLSPSRALRPSVQNSSSWFRLRRVRIRIRALFPAAWQAGGTPAPRLPVNPKEQGGPACARPAPHRFNLRSALSTTSGLRSKVSGLRSPLFPVLAYVVAAARRERSRLPQH